MDFDIYSMGFSPNEVRAVRSQVSLIYRLYVKIAKKPHAD